MGKEKIYKKEGTEKIYRKIDYYSTRDFPALGKIMNDNDGNKWKVISNDIRNVSTLEYVGPVFKKQ